MRPCAFSTCPASFTAPVRTPDGTLDVCAAHRAVLEAEGKVIDRPPPVVPSPSRTPRSALAKKTVFEVGENTYTVNAAFTPDVAAWIEKRHPGAVVLNALPHYTA